ncbi:hypothetical protein, partial [Stenotrophomonas sp. SrG]|uniref:hypothetical protein n=1 Tax=Stenotrophomonas sp. SrG TaxID=3414430 RepID=UPI003CF9908F
LYSNSNTDEEVDVLRGGKGDDRYYISEGYQYSNSPDKVIEFANEGIDTVYAESYSYSLPDNVENLVAVFNFDRWHWNNPE